MVLKWYFLTVFPVFKKREEEMIKKYYFLLKIYSTIYGKSV